MSESMSQEELDAMLKSMADDATGGGSSEGDSGMVAPPPKNSVEEDSAAETMGKTKKPLVQRVEFSQLKTRAKPATRQAKGNLFNNIPLVLSGELGNTEITVRDLLALEEGSVVRLDKTAGESATVLVNEQFLGQAETVVVNDRFGLRITSIGKETLQDKTTEPEKDIVSTSPPAEEVEDETETEG